MLLFSWFVKVLKLIRGMTFSKCYFEAGSVVQGSEFRFWQHAELLRLVDCGPDLKCGCKFARSTCSDVVADGC